MATLRATAAVVTASVTVLVAGCRERKPNELAPTVEPRAPRRSPPVRPPSDALDGVTVPIWDMVASELPTAGTVGTLVTVSQTWVSVDHERVANIPASHGDSSVRLAPLTMRVPTIGDPTRPIRVAVTPTLSYYAWFEVMTALVRAGHRRFELLGRRHGQLVSSLLTVPEAAADPDYGSVGLILSIDPGQVSVYSRSGLEGTAKVPKIQIPIDASFAFLERCRDVLAAIAHRRWNIALPSLADHTLTIVAAASVPVERVLALIAVIARSRDDSPLFSDVRLARIEGGTVDAPAMLGSNAEPLASPAAPAMTMTELDVAEPDVSGLNIRARVTKVYFPAIERCFHEALVTSPTLHGTLELSFTIRADGRVADGIAQGMREINGCVTRDMSQWRFAPPVDDNGKRAEAHFTTNIELAPAGS